jgi:hypothetical protein
VIDAVAVLLAAAKHHRGGGAQAERVGRAVNLLPFVARALEAGDAVANLVVEDFGLLALPNLQARLRAELRNWKVKRLNFGGIGLNRQSSRLFLSTGSSLLRYTLKEAWDHFLRPHFLRPAQLNGAIFFVGDLQNITGIGKSELALTIRDQFQSLGAEGMNYGNARNVVEFGH